MARFARIVVPGLPHYVTQIYGDALAFHPFHHSPRLTVTPYLFTLSVIPLPWHASPVRDRGLSVRQAAKAAQVDPADIKRIRNADLSRFTLDRLVRVVFRLGRRMEIKVLSVGGDVAA